MAHLYVVRVGEELHRLIEAERKVRVGRKPTFGAAGEVIAMELKTLRKAVKNG